jgi:hypothetical protein
MIETINKEFVNEYGWNCRIVIIKYSQERKVLIRWFRNEEPPQLIMLSYTAFAMLGQAMSEAQDIWCKEIVTALEEKE